MIHQLNYAFDTHVHFHDCYDEKIFFECATENFNLGASELGITTKTIGCLFLTESANAYYFRQLQEKIGGCVEKIWSVNGTLEDNSVVLHKRGETSLVLIAGRQIVTKENLEVLALGTSAEFPEGNSLAETVPMVRDHKAIPVIPWGFGKWCGKRGKILEGFLKSYGGNDIFLGDNSGRLRYLKRHDLFSLASSRGIYVLPGSDPLPFRSQNRFAGRYGVSLLAKIDLEKPTEGLKALLYEKKEDLQPFGQCSGIFNFCYYQVAMQLKKRMRRGSY